MDDLISRQQAIDAICEHGTDLERRGITVLAVANHKQVTVDLLENLPTVQTDDDRLERCRFEYINACKILAHRTPDTRKKDINDAYAVVRALNPIFGEEGF